MRFTSYWTALLTAGLLACGCSKVTEEPAQPGVGAHVQRGKEKRSLENDIRQLVTLLQTYRTDVGKPPKSWEEFKPYIRRDAPHIVREIDDQQVVVVWNSLTDPNAIVIYEREPDLRGTHVIARGDGSVHTLPTAQVREELQKQGIG